MSTKATIHFHFKDDDAPEAIVYRHWDGDPESTLPDLKRFFADVQEQARDTRFNDPPHLAAKYVVWQAHENARRYDGEKYVPTAMLDFSSVGVCTGDPEDIDYRYHIWCGSSSPPEVTWEWVFSFQEAER